MGKLIGISVGILLILLNHSCKSCDTPPTITMCAVTNITSNSAIFKGNLTSTCNDISIGFLTVYYDTVTNPIDYKKSIIIDQPTPGDFNGTIIGLKGNTSYYARVEGFYSVHLGLMKDEVHRFYGDKQVTIKTLPSGQK